MSISMLTNQTIPIEPGLNQDDNQSQDGDNFSHQIKQLHGSILTISWFVLLNMGIWSHYFKSYRYAIFIHVVCMCVIGFMMAIGATMMVANKGFDVIWQSFAHQTIGFFVFILLMPIVMLGGGIAKILRSYYGIEPYWVFTIQKYHRWFGWVIVVLVQFPLLTGRGWDQPQIGIALVLIDIISYTGYLYLKSKQQKIQSISLNQKFTTSLPPSSKPIRSQQQLQKIIINNNYFIFANYIYDIRPLIGKHPGGWNIIQQIRDRQIDRFVYGQQPLQSQIGKIPPISHSSTFLNLTTAPLYKISIQQTYQNLKQVNKFQIHSVFSNKQQSMYILYLQPKQQQQQITYTGYTTLKQLGRYHALTINGITRLYSVMNFLLPNHIKFMDRIMSADGIDVKKMYKKCTQGNADLLSGKSKYVGTVIQLQQHLIRKSQVQYQHVIPLYVKKYNNGKFTSELFNNIHQYCNKTNDDPKIPQIILSQARGFGLTLTRNFPKIINLAQSVTQLFQQQHHLNLIIFTGGTGINPFCDLLDLLYKQMLLFQNHSSMEYIISYYPILSRIAFRQFFNFTFYIAIQKWQLIHPITLYQCVELSNKGKIKCYIKCKQKYDRNNMMDIQMKSIQLLPYTFRFENAIEKQLKLYQNKKFYICGPGAMTRDIVERFRQLNIDPQMYRIV